MLGELNMFITKLSLPRRTFLRGMGATLALPLLDAMVPAMAGAAAARPPRRFGAVFVPMGERPSPPRAPCRSDRADAREPQHPRFGEGRRRHARTGSGRARPCPPGRVSRS